MLNRLQIYSISSYICCNFKLFMSWFLVFNFFLFIFTNYIKKLISNLTLIFITLILVVWNKYNFIIFKRKIYSVFLDMEMPVLYDILHYYILMYNSCHIFLDKQSTIFEWDCFSYYIKIGLCNIMSIPLSPSFIRLGRFGE